MKQTLTTWSIAIAIMTSQWVMAAPVNTTAPMVADAQMKQQILYYVNAYRLTHHLLPLKMNPIMSAEATQHSQNMANKRIPFGHQAFEHRIQRLYKEITPSRAGAENVAYYKWQAKQLVDAWVASPGHRRNIEGHYTLTGIGIAHGKPGWAYYTQIFLRVA